MQVFHVKRCSHHHAVIRRRPGRGRTGLTATATVGRRGTVLYAAALPFDPEPPCGSSVDRPRYSSGRWHLGGP
jgi:hypothetical protein